MRIFSRTVLSCLLPMAAIPLRPRAAVRYRPVDDKMLREAGADGKEWLTYSGNYAETRYSPVKQIDSSNAGKGQSGPGPKLFIFGLGGKKPPEKALAR